MDALFDQAVLAGCVFQGAVFGITRFVGCVLTGSLFDDIKVVAACVVDDQTVSRTFGYFHREMAGQRVDAPAVDRANPIVVESWISVRRALRTMGVDGDVIDAYTRGVEEIGGAAPSVFLSYSSQDEPFVAALRQHLEGNGVRCWFAPLEMMAGSTVEDQLKSALAAHARLVLVLSKASLASAWVGLEIAVAIKAQAALGYQIVFPIRICPMEDLEGWELQDGAGLDIASKIRSMYIPDFTGWADGMRQGMMVNQLVVALSHHSKEERLAGGWT